MASNIQCKQCEIQLATHHPSMGKNSTRKLNLNFKCLNSCLLSHKHLDDYHLHVYFFNAKFAIQMKSVDKVRQWTWKNVLLTFPTGMYCLHNASTENMYFSLADPGTRQWVPGNLAFTQPSFVGHLFLATLTNFLRTEAWPLAPWIR